jgi:hypothetical protein
MTQFFTVMTEDSALQCYLLYPKDCNELFEDVVLPFLKDNFDLEYHQLCYEGISRESIQLVRNTLQSECILLFAYVGEMTLEYSYKLGLAHAYDSHVVLINFQDGNYFDIPRCINFDFLVPAMKICNVEDLDSLLNKISNIMIAYLSADLIELLYRKAVSLCEELEQKTSQAINRVDKVTFSSRLLEEDISICVNDYNKSSRILLKKIVQDVKVLTIALNALNFQGYFILYK